MNSINYSSVDVHRFNIRHSTLILKKNNKMNACAGDIVEVIER